MSKMKKMIIGTVQSVTITVLLITIVWYFMHGMFLTGMPKYESVTKVLITNTQFSDEAKEYTDSESIELAYKLVNFLNYSLFAEPASGDTPVVSITYVTSDGEEFTVSASEQTVWWKGKAHALKDHQTFLKLVNSIFFSSENMAVME